MYIMEKRVKLAVIGGGAAGISAAVMCSEILGKESVVILEKQSRTGRKLLATGNGRCNITNKNISPSHYHGDRKIINSVINSFSFSDLKNFFGRMGLILREDTEGRMYPYSNQASTILECLQRELRRYKAEEICNFETEKIIKDKDKFIIFSADKKIYADYLIFASGSQASPHLGSDSSGYKLLEKSFGIKPSSLFPALSPISCKEKYHELKGVRAKGTVSVIADGKKLSFQKGEIQFNSDNISGICVFEISGMVNEFLNYGTINKIPYQSIKVCADLFSDYTYDELCRYLYDCKKIFSDCDSKEIFSAALSRKLSNTIVNICSLESKKCRSLTENDIKRLANTAKNMIFTPIKSDSYKSAQVSAGGIGSRYINPENLMCRKIPNLFICGEMLDVYGDCGGFNLHFSFGSAFLVSKYIKKENG